ncbi:MAG: glycosyltransferase family 4 protein [Candidatus Omnitrophica bacterium]|nr:glycosyltransferase family 4 protein [Candidatus Omnitrophota bacterium]
MKVKKIRISHIITRLDLGGAQKNTLDIVTLLDRSRYVIYFVSSDKGLLAKDVTDIPGIKTVFMPCLKHPISPFADLLALCKLILLFKKENIDLVHTHSSKAGILGRWGAKLAGVPLIVHTIHGWSFHNRLNFLTEFFYSFLERITAKFTNKLIAVSASDIQKGLDNRIASKDKYALIRYGIKKEQFLNCRIDINKKKREIGLDIDSPIVGMVACLKPQKSPQDFIKAASLVKRSNPRVQFLLVGDGILRKRAECLVNKLNLREDFILTGWRRDIPEIMSCLDILVLSSLWEGQPLVFLEAMYSRLPIVAYNVDGAKEVVKDGINGFLVAPGDFSGLASRVNDLLKNRRLLKEMGENGFNLAMNNGYHIERMAADLDKLYCNLDRLN